MIRVRGLFKCAALVAVSAALLAATAAAGENENIKIRDGKMYSWKGFPGPCPAPSQSLILLEKEIPLEVVRGDTYTYEIQVTNRSAYTMKQIVVTDTLPDNFKLESSDPAGTVTGKTIQWVFKDFAPKESRLITLKGQATAVGTLVHAGDAEVTFVLPCSVQTVAVEPKLAITKSLPAEVNIWESIPCRIVVTNPGSFAATNVVITDTLPANLVTADGKNAFEMKVGTLRPGESKEFAGNLKALESGTYVNKALAAADRGLTAEASATVVVHKAVLKITKAGPKDTYIGYPIPYDITVTNTGDAPAIDTVIEDTPVPQSLQFLSASDEGKVSRRDSVVWQLGTLAPKESKTVHMQMQSDMICVAENTAVATAKHVEPVSASVKTNVLGIAGVLLECRDVMDPVPVGAATTYIIEVTNQGSKTGTNIRLTATLEDGQEFVSANGDTEVKADGKTLNFAALAELPAGARATWKVTVKAVKPGDIRFKVDMMSDQLKGRPATKIEATNQYAPEMVSSDDKTTAAVDTK